jgi:DinB superfamily
VRPGASSAISQLLALLDEAFDRKAWHGTTLLGSVRGVTEAEASWRPGAGRHNIWELVVHAEYWKYAVRRRLAGEPRGTFRLAGSNWFERPATGASFRAEVRRLVEEHRRLRLTVAALAPARLARRFPGRKETPGFVIRGIAAHDLYHAGQIQLIKALQGIKQ